MRRHIIRGLFAAAALGLVLPVAAAGAAEPAGVDPSQVERFVTDQMDKHRVPGLSLALIEDGEVTHVSGFGNAKDGAPVTPTTPFVLGSISKTFTAVAVLQLVEQGLVDLDVPVRTYLPTFAVDDEATSATITVRQLLQHTSGLSELGYNRVLDRTLTLEQAVADLQHARPTAPAGTRFQYFNQGYSVLALVVQTVSGQPFGAYVAEHIFEPLDMTHSFVDRRAATEAGLAQGHTKLFGFPIARDLPHTEYGLGYGQLISTAQDLARFAVALSHEGTHGNATILSPASVALMRTPPAGVETAYGMGWQVWQSDNTRLEGHSGGEETFMASLTLLPEHDAGYLWLMNQEHFLDPVRAQLDAGLIDLLSGREPDLGGRSMRWLGLGLLAAVLTALAFTIRSLRKLRGWTERARTMSTGAVARTIAPHVAVPIAVLWVAYHHLGPLVLGAPVAWNFRYVGSYFFPEVALLLILATVPDLLRAAYMTASVTADRALPRPRTFTSDRRAPRRAPRSGAHAELTPGDRQGGCVSIPGHDPRTIR